MMNKELFEKAETYAKSICDKVGDLTYRRTHESVLIEHLDFYTIGRITERLKNGYRRSGVLHILVGMPGRHRKIYKETKAGIGLDRQNILDEINKIIRDELKAKEVRKRNSNEWNAVSAFLHTKTSRAHGSYQDVGRFRAKIEGESGRRVSIKVTVEFEDYDSVIEALRQA